MSDEKALLAAIWEHPHDDTVRLVYADWLQETEQPANVARAEFIRVQCERLRCAGDDPQYDALEAREEALRGTWEKAWWKAMPMGARRGRFSRGLPVPDLSQFSIPGLVRLDVTRLRAAALWRYHYGVNGDSLDALLGWPFLHRLELFALRPPLPDGWSERLAECSNLRNVSELSLLGCPVAPNELVPLLDAWANRSLRAFAADLNANGIRVLVGHPTAVSLRSLRLESCGVTADTLRALTADGHLTGLDSLTLGYNAFGDEGLDVLLRWSGLRKLRWLGVNNTGITTAGAEALAACPATAGLRRLWLSSNQIGHTGARAIAASPHLAKLAWVSFYNTPAVRDPATETVLRQRFGKGRY